MSASNKTSNKNAAANNSKPASEEIKTDIPMSEKDEVKNKEGVNK